MQILNETLKEFITALESSQCIHLRSDGQWQIVHPFKLWLWRVFRRENSAKAEFIKAFNACLDALEFIPVVFGGSQKVDYYKWLRAAHRVKKHLPHLHSQQITEEYRRLERGVLALKYRLEASNGGLNPTHINLELAILLREAADQWKSRQKIFWDSNLSQRDCERLSDACRYPEFVSLVLDDENLLNEFLSWALRDGIDVVPFIEFPGMQKKLVECHLNGRIGRLGGEHIAVIKVEMKKGQDQKVLALLMEGRFESLLDMDRQVVFKGNYRLTIKDILEIFREKKLKAGNLELFAGGVTNWNSHCLGWWNGDTLTYEVIDLNDEEWWRQLPLFELLTVEEAKDRYGDRLDGEMWNLSAKASREYLTLNFDKTHAYLELVIPIGSGYYEVYEFGKFATQFPNGTVETLMMISVSMPATIAYPDENVYYTQRQHVGYSFALTRVQGMKYMDSIKEDMLQARKGNIVFQIETENCGKWIQSRLEELLGKENVPNLYRTALIDSEPVGLLAYGWKIIRLMPQFCQSKILAWCHFPLGAWKGRWIVDKSGKKVWKSLSTSSYWDDGIVYLPSYLHKQHESGALPEEPGHQTTYFSGYAEIKQRGIKMDKDPFKSLDVFDKSA